MCEIANHLIMANTRDSRTSQGEIHYKQIAHVVEKADKKSQTTTFLYGITRVLYRDSNSVPRVTHV